MKSFLIYLGVWIALFYAPIMASEEYYEAHFNFYQSIVPLTLILLSTLLMPSGLRKQSMFSVLILQLSLNVTDALFNINPDQYNGIQGVLNSIEAMLLFIWGAEVWSDYVERAWYGDNPPRGNRHDPQRVRHRG